MYYPANFLAEETGGYSVSFPDIPEALTCGDNLEDALDMAQDALITALDFYFDDGRAVPLPGKFKEGQYLIELPASIWAKVLLLNEMAEQRVSQAELARRLHRKPQEVTRMVNLHHTTKIDTLSAAFKALGKELQISTV